MNKLVRYIYFLLFILGVAFNADGQMRPYRMPERRPFFDRPKNTNPEHRVLTVKVNYLKNRLNLPSGQAEKFFPLYQEYQQELFNVRKLKRQNNLNAADGTDQINKELLYENEIVQIKIKFNNAFLKVLPPDKVSELYKSEREFNDELVRQLSERGGQATVGPNP